MAASETPPPLNRFFTRLAFLADAFRLAANGLGSGVFLVNTDVVSGILDWTKFVIDGDNEGLFGKFLGNDNLDRAF